MAISRNQQNYIVMTIVYEALTDLSVHKTETFRGFEELVNDFAISEILSEAEVDISEAKTNKYIVELVDASLRNYAAIINMIAPKLKGWAWERIPLISQAILLMSVAHYTYVEKIDKSIIISVAIDLAKKYVEEKQAKFIHALLDEVLE